MKRKHNYECYDVMLKLQFVTIIKQIWVQFNETGGDFKSRSLDSRITKSVLDHTRRESQSLAFKCQRFVCQFPRRENYTLADSYAAHPQRHFSASVPLASTQTATISRHGMFMNSADSESFDKSIAISRCDLSTALMH